MTEQERLVFEQDLKKVKRGFIAIMLTLAFVLLCIMNCNNNKYNQLKGEYKVLDESYKKQKDDVKDFEETRKVEADSLNGEISKREKVNAQLSSTNEQLQTKIDVIQGRKINVPKDTPCYELAVKAEEGQKAIEIVPLQKEIIENQGTQIVNLEKDKKDTETKLTSAELDVQKQKDLNASADVNIGNLEKQVSKLQTKSTLTKILIPASFLIGGYIGFQIAK